MPGVFLSHSSYDKPFVFRLAADLVSSGISVWLDTWELELGDSLTDRIFSGIDSSTFLLVALSSNSINSAWVRRELDAALSKEALLGRKVILPLRIDDCQIPEAVADRLYADFAKGYRAALEALITNLSRVGAADVNVPIEHELIPLRFAKGIYVEEATIQRRYEALVPKLGGGQAMAPEQILVVPDQAYEAVRKSFLATLDTFEDSAAYTPESETEIMRLYESVRRGEAGLKQGIAALATGLVASREWAFFSLSAHWFCRLVRNELIARIDMACRYAGIILEPSVPPVHNGLSQATTAAKLFDVSEVRPCDVFNPEPGNEYIRVWVDAETEVGRWFEQAPQFHQPLLDFWDPTLVYKFVVPQMLVHHFWYSPRTPLAWDLAKWRIGAA